MLCCAVVVAAMLLALTVMECVNVQRFCLLLFLSLSHFSVFHTLSSTSPSPRSDRIIASSVLFN